MGQTRRLPGWRSWLLVTGCAGVSWAVVEMTSIVLFVVGGSAPAAIWGPVLRRDAMAAILAATLVPVLVARGRRRVPALALWLAALAVLTHRVVDLNVDGVRDQWLTLPIGTVAWNEVDPAPARCDRGMAAICVGPIANRRRWWTVIAFAPMREVAGRSGYTLMPASEGR